jgi:hypothetical protein
MLFSGHSDHIEYIDIDDADDIDVIETSVFPALHPEKPLIDAREKEDNEVEIMNISSYVDDNHMQVDKRPNESPSVIDDSRSLPAVQPSTLPKNDTEMDWNFWLADKGVKRITLVQGPPETEEDGSSLSHPDSIDLTNDIPQDKKKRGKGNGSSKKKSKKQPPPEPEEEIVFTEQDRLEQQLRERGNELEALQQLHATISKLSSMLVKEEQAPFPRAVARTVSDLLDEVIFEIVQESHFCLLVDHEEAKRRLEPRGGGTDIFGQDPAAVRTDSFMCGNHCGRLVSSNRYAPHLEKCTGLSGMKAKPSRRSSAD